MSAVQEIGKAQEEYALSDAQFKQISEYIRRETGIVIEDHKKQMIYARLSRRLRALDLQSFDKYLELLNGSNKKSEIQDFVNSVTTNLTSFFRESHHFEHLVENVINPTVVSGSSKLRIWSAGCSTGEEPHCIAMSILDNVPHAGVDFKVLATDLDTKVLNTASEGIYPIEKLEGIPKPLQKFTQKLTGGGQFQFGKDVRGLIHFKQLNLLSKWPMAGPFDAIFCRNVLIYFDAQLKGELIDKFANLLKPNGFLYIGHSESILGTHPRLNALGRTIYQRKP